ncbi:Uncharacterized conserved protein, DUF2267 family [Micromonospora phaseoli]|uniref:Uncharacterized conserved protein, DUF2267 family n=1 Tax=Micromonospora phaseoli TaxID=1144548 RepID=A0A1H6VA13_9ACTN|nr:DUF2267 domain-containing protein [Micromonospora phaseoli]PZV93644.1 uncharacterized protein (DUF2267 family) [Micromonospora phaseoli]GIJ79802.1 hypothetical protein Xph01_42340 [Micromonospora phaseoli]SEJ01388.1 Uncharacterized conserved protein, DUF2267 family [Micromonospora phaseoli]
MDDHQFIDSVAHRTGASVELATAMARATLTTLAERLDGATARDLADRLPEGLRAYTFAPSDTAERFELDVFVQRVSSRSDVEPDLAAAGIRAVLDTLRDAVTVGEHDDVIAELPAELWQLANPAPQYDAHRNRG